MEGRSKRIWGALLLGPLAILLGPIGALGFFGLILLGDFVLGHNTVSARLLGREMAVLYGILAWGMSATVILGSLGAAFISWLRFRSWKLAVLTLAVAIPIQLATTYWSFSSTFRQSSEQSARMTHEIETSYGFVDSIYRTRAELDTIRYEMRIPLDAIMDNAHPEWGPVYRQIVLEPELRIRHPGRYSVYVEFFSGDSAGTRRALPGSAVDSLGPGIHAMPVVLDSWYSGLWSPAVAGAVLRVRAYAEVSARARSDYANSRMNLSQSDRALLGKTRADVANDTLRYPVPLDTLVVEIPKGRSFPKSSRWAPTPKPSGLTDRQQQERGRSQTRP